MMKKLNFTSISFCLLLSLLSFSLVAQTDSDEPTLPGDGLSLEGVLELFKNSESIEAFEKSLNTADNYVNNLDLNEDGETDFIKVNDLMEDDLHAIVLQVDLNAEETQDVAVIEIEKTGNESATLQIVGDEDVYGTGVYVEPFEVEEKMEGKGPSADLSVTRIIVNVWFWPSVRFIYRPVYRPYVSAWRWGYYPTRWWKPWRVRPYSVCHTYRVRYYQPRYRVVSTRRIVRANRIYAPQRRTTTVVRTRTTRVAAVNKNVKVGKRTTTTAVKTKNGNVVGKKTTTTRAAKVGPNKKAVGKKTTTTKVGKTKNGNVVGKKTTTKKGVQSNGRKAGTKKTVTKKRGKRG